MFKPTTIVSSARLDKRMGMQILLASETFQHTGSFKFRAAWCVAETVPQTHLIAASSGNFGQALAYACQVLGKRCTIVMPDNAPQVKIDAVRGYGATVDIVDITKITREQRVEDLMQEFPDAYKANPYDDDLVIQGNSSLGRELSQLDGIDAIIVPVSGGGLSSGVVKGLRESRCHVDVYGAEPALDNDAARSLREGRIVANDQQSITIADGARGVSLGIRNWAIIKDGIKDIIEVSEHQIVEALRMLFFDANMKVEPTGALALGALIADSGRFRGQKVCCTISGGNVDDETYTKLLLQK